MLELPKLRLMKLKKEESNIMAEMSTGTLIGAPLEVPPELSVIVAVQRVLANNK